MPRTKKSLSEKLKEINWLIGNGHRKCDILWSRHAKRCYEIYAFHMNRSDWLCIKEDIINSDPEIIRIKSEMDLLKSDITLLLYKKKMMSQI